MQQQLIKFYTRNFEDKTKLFVKHFDVKQQHSSAHQRAYMQHTNTLMANRYTRMYVVFKYRLKYVNVHIIYNNAAVRPNAMQITGAITRCHTSMRAHLIIGALGGKPQLKTPRKQSSNNREHCWLPVCLCGCLAVWQSGCLVLPCRATLQQWTAHATTSNDHRFASCRHLSDLSGMHNNVNECVCVRSPTNTSVSS